MLSGVPDHVDGRMLGIVESGRRQHHQPGPHVALHGGHHQLRADLEPRTASASCRARRRCGSTPPASACRCRCSRASTRWARSAHLRTHRPRLVLVRPDAEDHRARVRPVGLGAEPRSHGQEHPEGARAPLRRAGPRGRLQEAGRGFHRAQDAARAGGRDERARRRGADRRRRAGARDRRARPRDRQPLHQGRPGDGASAARATTSATS